MYQKLPIRAENQYAYAYTGEVNLEIDQKVYCYQNKKDKDTNRIEMNLDLAKHE